MNKGSAITLSAFLLGSMLLLWVTGDLMRESDQASLLYGALQLKNTPDTPPTFHNFSGQFGSYWLLALAQKSLTFDSLASYVTWGNVFALTLFLIGLGIYLGSYATQFAKRHFGGRHLLILASLTTPAVLLSLPLLSSNILGGAAILALIGCEKLWTGKRKGGLILGCLLVGGAVMLRKDTAFLLPMVCLMPMSRLDFRDLVHQPFLWAFLLTTLGVCVFGRMIAPISYLPHILTDWKLIGCYGLFGLLGCGIILLWGCRQIWIQTSAPLMRAIGIAGILLPVLMYLPFLYSPRHLLMAGLIPLILARSHWLKEPCWTNPCLALALGVNLMWLLVCPIIHKDGKISFGMKNATCYPTADGLWPIGGGLHFLGRMRQASLHGYAIDHNQEIWTAFCHLAPLQNMERYTFQSHTPQKSYLYLWATFHGAPSPASPFSNTSQTITVTTDRDYLKSRAPLPTHNIVSTEAGRLIFMTPLLYHSPLDSLVITRHQELRNEYEGVEFIHTSLPKKQEGHIYVEKEGVLLKSNYPEILTRSF